MHFNALIYCHAARVEHHLLNNVESKGTVKVEWAKRPIELSIDDNTVDDDEKIYPVFVSIVDADRSSQTDGTSAMVTTSPLNDDPDHTKELIRMVTVESKPARNTSTQNSS